MTHKFIVELNLRGQLAKSYTQNVDELEIKAGLPLEKQLNCHGHIRTAACANRDCATPFDMTALREIVFNTNDVPYCEKCGSPVKPDFLLYGQRQSYQLHDNLDELLTADLVFVMGTSLRAYPFSGFVSLVPPEAPVVLINLEDPYLHKPDKFLFLQGDIDMFVEKIMAEMQ